MKRLLIRPGSIGDFILSLPTLQALASEQTEVWTAAPNVSLVRFAQARSISSTGLDLLGLPEVDPPPALLARLRSFDQVISWYGANRPEFRQALSSLVPEAHFFPALPPPGCTLHATDFYLQQVQALAIKTISPVPVLPCAPAPERSFIAIHPFSGSPRKNWPLDRYAELTRVLGKSWEVRWILPPGATPPPGVATTAPTADLFELACRIAQAFLYIGNDSGITHLAAAAGVPVLALFGPTDPGIWAPRSLAPVRVLRSPAPDGNMKAISLEAVLDALRSLLESISQSSAYRRP